MVYFLHERIVNTVIIIHLRYDHYFDLTRSISCEKICLDRRWMTGGGWGGHHWMVGIVGDVSVKQNAQSITHSRETRTNSPGQFISLFNTHPIVSSINGLFLYIYFRNHSYSSSYLAPKWNFHSLRNLPPKINRFGDCLILKMCKTIDVAQFHILYDDFFFFISRLLETNLWWYVRSFNHYP